MRSGSRRTVAWVWWVLVGAVAGVGVVSLLSIGVFLLALALIMALAGLRLSKPEYGSACMALAGAAAAPLLLAWINRSGPGQVCTVAGDVTSCSDRYSPWPFVVAAIVLVTAGLALTWLAHRRARTSPGG